MKNYIQFLIQDTLRLNRHLSSRGATEMRSIQISKLFWWRKKLVSFSFHSTARKHNSHNSLCVFKPFHHSPSPSSSIHFAVNHPRAISSSLFFPHHSIPHFIIFNQQRTIKCCKYNFLILISLDNFNFPFKLAQLNNNVVVSRIIVEYCSQFAATVLLNVLNLINSILFVRCAISLVLFDLSISIILKFSSIQKNHTELSNFSLLLRLISYFLNINSSCLSFHIVCEANHRNDTKKLDC